MERHEPSDVIGINAYNALALHALALSSRVPSTLCCTLARLLISNMNIWCINLPYSRGRADSITCVVWLFRAHANNIRGRQSQSIDPGRPDTIESVQHLPAINFKKCIYLFCVQSDVDLPMHAPFAVHADTRRTPSNPIKFRREKKIGMEMKMETAKRNSVWFFVSLTLIWRAIRCVASCSFDWNLCVFALKQ